MTNGRPDLAVETLVLGREWGHLFKQYDHKKAKENLRVVGFSKRSTTRMPSR
jgi:hypothetical protein